MKKTILVIDDDKKLNQLLKDFLGDFGFHTFTATHPAEGLTKLRQKSPDLVILDVMLPEMNGFEVCKQIRQTHSVPVIILTARGEPMDKIVGLEIGADDYVAKPFEPRELVARIQAVLRRSQKINETFPRKLGRLEIDFPRRIVCLDGKPLDLTTNEFTTLTLLAGNPGKVFDRDQILQELSGIDSDAFNRTVDITISRLRQKLKDDPQKPSFIKTVWGAGYVFIGKE
jgi:DNA-binding response OmpR family regulator